MLNVDALIDATFVAARVRGGAGAVSHIETDAWTDPVKWIEENFYLYDTAELITFHERQRRPLVEALRRNDDGTFVYNTILWSWPKKSAKSSVIAAVCLYILCHQTRASIKLVANDQKQSDSRVGYYLREAIKIATKKERNLGNFKITPSGYRIDNLDNGARCEMLPIDPSGEAGGNDDLIVYSELHGWKSAAHQRMWSEMTISPNKFGYSQRWIDTYAGWIGESPILENLYEMVVKPERRLWDDWEVYTHPAAKMLATWVTQHHLSWQVGESGHAYYAEEEATLTPNENRRMHHNEWVSSVDAFVQPEQWDACKGAIPAFDDKMQVVIGMDAGISSDCFALVGVSRVKDVVYVRFARVWKPPKGGTIDFSEVERAIRDELVKRYNVVQIAYDAHELHDMSTRLTRDGVVWMYRFEQGKSRLIADKLLYDTILGRRIVHSDIPALTEHIKNANALIDKQDHSLRIVKRSDSLKIDAAVALSMAVEELMRLSI
jgi:phage terminase large subunit-like protein